jgi:hypothetical protein
MFAGLPLILAPLLVYDLVVLGLFGPTPGDPWVQPVFTLSLPSDGRFTLLVGDVLIVAALLCLVADLRRRIGHGAPSVLDRGLPLAVFLVHAVQFLFVAAAATSVFLVLSVIAAIDAATAFARPRGGRRD